MVDETGLDEPKVDESAEEEIAVDKSGPHQESDVKCFWGIEIWYILGGPMLRVEERTLPSHNPPHVPFRTLPTVSRGAAATPSSPQKIAPPHVHSHQI